jgi:hypothetical protein
MLSSSGSVWHLINRWLPVLHLIHATRGSFSGKPVAPQVPCATGVRGHKFLICSAKERVGNIQDRGYHRAACAVDTLRSHLQAAEAVFL